MEDGEQQELVGIPLAVPLMQQWFERLVCRPDRPDLTFLLVEKYDGSSPVFSFGSAFNKKTFTVDEWRGHNAVNAVNVFVYSEIERLHRPELSKIFVRLEE